jgi:hypothetical protein
MEEPMRALLIGAAFAAAATAATARAAPLDQPYALVERGDPSETRKEATLSISSIDGVGTRDPRMPDPIPPGKHTIKLHFVSARGIFRPEYVDLELDLAPCTRYRIVANYVSKTGGTWTPKVYPEPIGECRKKFGIK